MFVSVFISVRRQEAFTRLFRDIAILDYRGKNAAMQEGWAGFE
jgi:hypothetical protein